MALHSPSIGGPRRNPIIAPRSEEPALQPQQPARARTTPEPVRDGFEPARAAPVNLGNTAATAAAGDRPQTYPGGIDRRRFLAELQRRPDLVRRAAWMVRGEVGAGAPLQSRIQMLETAFNRAQVRGHSLEHALLSVGESRRGYYARQTYRGNPPTDAEVQAFKRDVLAPVLAGSDLTSLGGRGPMTGNASAGVAQRQLARGTPGFPIRIAGGQVEHLFNEERRDLRDPRNLARLDQQGAEDAARAAQRMIPGGVLPPPPSAGPRAAPPETPAPQAPRAGRSRRRGRARSRRRSTQAPSSPRPRRTSGTPPAQRSTGTRSMAQPQATARTDQIAQSFMAWLQGRVPSPQLLQQFFAENPDQLQALQTGATPGFSGRDTFEAARA